MSEAADVPDTTLAITKCEESIDASSVWPTKIIHRIAQPSVSVLGALPWSPSGYEGVLRSPCTEIPGVVAYDVQSLRNATCPDVDPLFVAVALRLAARRSMDELRHEVLSLTGCLAVHIRYRVADTDAWKHALTQLYSTWMTGVQRRHAGRATEQRDVMSLSQIQYDVGGVPELETLLSHRFDCLTGRSFAVPPVTWDAEDRRLLPLEINFLAQLTRSTISIVRVCGTAKQVHRQHFNGEPCEPEAKSWNEPQGSGRTVEVWSGDAGRFCLLVPADRDAFSTSCVRYIRAHSTRTPAYMWPDDLGGVAGFAERWEAEHALQAVHEALFASYTIKKRGENRFEAACAAKGVRQSGELLIPTAVLDLNFSASDLIREGNPAASRLTVLHHPLSALSEPILDPLRLGDDSRSCRMLMPLLYHNGRWALAPFMGAQCTSMDSQLGEEDINAIRPPDTQIAAFSVASADFVQGPYQADKSACTAWIPIPLQVAKFSQARAGKVRGRRPGVFVLCGQPSMTNVQVCASCRDAKYAAPDANRRLAPGSASDRRIRSRRAEWQRAPTDKWLSISLFFRPHTPRGNVVLAPELVKVNLSSGEPRATSEWPDDVVIAASIRYTREHTPPHQSVWAYHSSRVLRRRGCVRAGDLTLQVMCRRRPNHAALNRTEWHIASPGTASVNEAEVHFIDLFTVVKDDDSFLQVRADELLADAPCSAKVVFNFACGAWRLASSSTLVHTCAPNTQWVGKRSTKVAVQLVKKAGIEVTSLDQLRSLLRLMRIHEIPRTNLGSVFSKLRDCHHQSLFTGYKLLFWLQNAVAAQMPLATFSVHASEQLCVRPLTGNDGQQLVMYDFEKMDDVLKQLTPVPDLRNVLAVPASETGKHRRLFIRITRLPAPGDAIRWNILKRILYFPSCIEQIWNCSLRLLAVDGCHGRTEGGGVWLIASTALCDGSFCALGFAYVETEDEDSVSWFLSELNVKLKLEEARLAVITDRGAALLNSIAEHFKNATHYRCAVHIIRNGKSKFGINGPAIDKWCLRLAKAHTDEDYASIEAEIRANAGFDPESPEAHYACTGEDSGQLKYSVHVPKMVGRVRLRVEQLLTWLHGLRDIEKWCLSATPPGADSRHGFVSNNLIESLNSAFVPMRTAAPTEACIYLMDHIATKFAAFCRRIQRAEAPMWDIVPGKFSVLQEQYLSERQRWTVTDMSTDGRAGQSAQTFLVSRRSPCPPDYTDTTRFTVSKGAGSSLWYCECRVTEHLGVLCEHVCAVLHSCKLQITSFVHDRLRWSRVRTIVEHLDPRSWYLSDTGRVDALTADIYPCLRAMQPWLKSRNVKRLTSRGETSGGWGQRPQQIANAGVYCTRPTSRTVRTDEATGKVTVQETSTRRRSSAADARPTMSSSTAVSPQTSAAEPRPTTRSRTLVSSRGRHITPSAKASGARIFTGGT